MESYAARYCRKFTSSCKNIHSASEQYAAPLARNYSSHCNERAASLTRMYRSPWNNALSALDSSLLARTKRDEREKIYFNGIEERQAKESTVRLAIISAPASDVYQRKGNTSKKYSQLPFSTHLRSTPNIAALAKFKKQQKNSPRPHRPTPQEPAEAV